MTTPSARPSTPPSRRRGSTGNPGRPAPRRSSRDLRVHRGLVQPAAPALHARLPLPDRVRATPHRARPTGARGPDFGQRIGRVALAEGLRSGLQRVASRRSASISLPTPRSLPRTPPIFKPLPLIAAAVLQWPRRGRGKSSQRRNRWKADARGQTSGGAATLAERPTLVSGLCKASVVAKAESVGRGLSGDGRFNRFDRTPRPTGAASA